MERTVLRRTIIILASLAGLIALLHAMKGVAIPVLLAFLLAYGLDPLIDRLESWRLPRAVSILILLAFLLISLTLIFLFLVPMIYEEIATVIGRVPAYMERLQTVAVPWLERTLGVRIPTTLEESLAQLGVKVGGVAPSLFQPLSSLLQGAFTSTIGLLMDLLRVLLVPLFTFYFLHDFDRITAWIRDNLVPRPYLEAVRITMLEVDNVLSSFIRGQLTVCLILGSLYSVGLSIVGIPMGLVIGLLAGLATMVPYLGVPVGLSLSLVMAFLEFKGWGQVVGALAVFATVQALDSVLITPKVLGKQVGLSPVVVIMAVLAGGELFGFLGVLLAVPTTAVLKILLVKLLVYYRQSSLYEGPFPVAPHQEQDAPLSPNMESEEISA